MNIASTMAAAAFFVEKVLPETLPEAAQHSFLREELTVVLGNPDRLLALLLGDSRVPQDLALLGLPVPTGTTPAGLAQHLEQAVAEGVALLARLHPVMPLAEEGLLRAIGVWDPATPRLRLELLDRLSAACQQAARLVHDLQLLLAQAQLDDASEPVEASMSASVAEAREALQQIVELNARMRFDDLAASMGARAELAETILVDGSFDAAHREALDSFGALLGRTHHQGIGSAIQRAIDGTPETIDGQPIGSPGWADGPLERLAAIDLVRRRWSSAEPLSPLARLDALTSLRDALEGA